jgi:hypothetical protein
MNYSSEFVRPLHVAENSFLQVLLHQFELNRSGQGARLSVRFDNDTPAISTRHGKNYLQGHIPDFDRKQEVYQKRLNAVLLEQTADSFTFSDEDFPFRYCSGGALPVLRMGDVEYYCLFYRDIYPVGWNIANGGSDSRAELLYPLTTMERELREELIILNPDARLRYVFSWDSGTPEDRAEFAMARKIWTRSFPELDVAAFKQLKLPLKWLDGPDSIDIRMGEEDKIDFGGCFVNINARDFGIEIDKVAKINLADDAVLLDGEILDNKVLNRPVGLFEVARMDRQLRSGATQLIPDVFYYNGARREGSQFEETIHTEFTETLGEVRTPEEIAYFTGLELKFDLCPVTRSIMCRYEDLLRSWGPLRSPAPPRRTKAEVFISCGRGDEELARGVYEFVTGTKGLTAFFYEDDPASHWGRQIDDALASAKCLIVVGSDRHRLSRHWPEFEWRSFHNAIQSGKKPRSAKLIPFVVGLNPKSVPTVLSYYRMVVCENLDLGLSQLNTLM